MLSQRRASGGIWFTYGGSRGVIDPGPGSLVRICDAEPPLSAIDINTIILTHKHIDHSSDMNALVEGMTLKSREKKGSALMPRDCVSGGDAVLLKHFADRIKDIHFHEDRAVTKLVTGTTVESVAHKHHGVECYGLIFRGDGLPTWGVISDTSAQAHFPERYSDCRMLIINTTLPLPKATLDHMSAADAESLMQVLHPRLAVLTHMGNMLLDMGPERIASRISTDQTRAIAATDGMIINLDELS
jgi:phosphoribosyl 1,2-cyclic phosphodiesterase